MDTMERREEGNKEMKPASEDADSCTEPATSDCIDLQASSAMVALRSKMDDSDASSDPDPRGVAALVCTELQPTSTSLAKRSRSSNNKGMKLVQLEVREWTELLATFFAPPHNGKDVASFAAQMNEARKLAGKSEFKANTFANKASDERKAALREGREPGKRPACDTLHAPNAKRVHAREYEAVEKQLCAYLELRAQATKATKIGVPWTSLAARCIKWAQQLYDEEKASKFKCSAGWLSSVLKRGNCNYVSLEAGDADAETELAGMTDIKQQIALMCEHHGIEPSCIVSAGPTRLHYGQLPNIVFTKKNDRFSPQGIKRLQTKESITVMVCVTADGDKAPLAVIATGKSPPCFTLVDEPPLAYISQPRAWVDEDLTIRWINDVLMPWHRERKGPDSWLLLLLENCPAHARAESHPQYPKKGLKTIVVPANLTRRQPVDQGLTWSLKCGYKFAMLRELVSLAEDTPRYEAAFKAGKNDEAAKVIAELDAQQKSSHKEFRKPKPKQ